MEDPELTRKAIQELMKEMTECKEKESIPMERKKNPLGRPNKLFLGRTISSIMTHNKRQSDRNLQKCKRKLKEMDATQRKHRFKKHRGKVKLKYFHEVINSDSYDEEYTNKSRKNIKKNKKKRTRSCSPSSSSSSESSSSSNKMDFSNSNENSPIQNKYKNHKTDMTIKEEEYRHNFCSEYNNDSTVGYYLDPNIAYAAMAYNQINHMMQQHELIQQHELVQQQSVKNELEESIEIPSDLDLSCHSSPESSLNISLHSSSAEEDENGILTFKLSSDDEEKISHISQKVNEKSTEISNENSPIDCDEYEKDSVYSHISLESNDSQNSAQKGSNKIYSLSSSCADSDSVEIVETLNNVKSFSAVDKNIKEDSLQISEMCISENLNK